MVDVALGDSTFLGRIESSFTPSDMTSENLEEFLYPSEKRRSHRVKWGKTRSGKQRYKDVDGSPISSGTKKLAEELSKTGDIFNEIESSKNERELEKVRIKAEKSPVHSSTLVSIAQNKIEEIRRERLEKAGKKTTIYRDELKKATSEGDIDKILSEAESELGQGKNLQSLEAAAEILRGRL